MLSGKVKDDCVNPVTPSKVEFIESFKVVIKPVREVSQYISNKEYTGFVSAIESIGAMQCIPNVASRLAKAVTCAPITLSD